MGRGVGYKGRVEAFMFKQVEEREGFVDKYWRKVKRPYNRKIDCVIHYTNLYKLLTICLTNIVL